MSANLRSSFKVFCWFIFLSLIVLHNSDANAEIKEIIQTVIQPFSGAQSPDEARQYAIAKAKREALEKAGTYLDSLTVVRNGIIQSDELTMLTSGIINLEVLSQKNYVDGEIFGIEIIAKVTLDMAILDSRVKEYANRKHTLKKEKEITPSHKYKKDKTIISWFDDNEFLDLSYEQKRKIIANYFNAKYTDKEFYNMPLEKQYQAINNFVRAHIGNE